MVGIAIINYNTYEKTIECIESIRKYTDTPYRIYLLDNDSKNESKAVLEAEYKNSDDVVFIESKENLGYARGNNLCIEYMLKDDCDLCVVSNNDILCHSKTIDKLCGCLKENPDYAIVAPKIYGIDGKFLNSFKINKQTAIEYLKENTYFSKFFKKQIAEKVTRRADVDEFMQVYWVSGAFFVADLMKFRNINFFDPYTFLFYEESILSNKCQKNGYKIGYLPSAGATHYHAVSTGGGENIITKTASLRSELYYWKKYEEEGNCFLNLLYCVRLLEATFTFGKKKEFDKIKSFAASGRSFLKEMKNLT